MARFRNRLEFQEVQPGVQNPPLPFQSLYFLRRAWDRQQAGSTLWVQPGTSSSSETHWAGSRKTQSHTDENSGCASPLV